MRTTLFVTVLALPLFGCKSRNDSAGVKDIEGRTTPGIYYPPPANTNPALTATAWSVIYTSGGFAGPQGQLSATDASGAIAVKSRPLVCKEVGDLVTCTATAYKVEINMQGRVARVTASINEKDPILNDLICTGKFRDPATVACKTAESKTSDKVEMNGEQTLNDLSKVLKGAAPVDAIVVAKLGAKSPYTIATELAGEKHCHTFGKLVGGQAETVEHLDKTGVFTDALQALKTLLSEKKFNYGSVSDFNDGEGCSVLRVLFSTPDGWYLTFTSDLSA